MDALGNDLNDDYIGRKSGGRKQAAKERKKGNPEAENRPPKKERKFGGCMQASDGEKYAGNSK